MDRRIARALAIMRRDLHHDLSLVELAGAVNLSVSRFAHLFRAETGLAPKQCLLSLRLERAKALLEGSFLSAKQVMAAVGMNDPSHFSRDFRHHFGVRPTALRSGSGLEAGHYPETSGETGAGSANE
jgi:AraC family transcriptional regulator of arabinose operon